MITDFLLRTSTAQALTTTAVSTDKVDLSQARDIGEGEDLYVVFTVNSALTGGTSVSFEAVIADDAAISTNVEVIGMTGAIAAASLTANSQFVVRLAPRIGRGGRRYFATRYTIVGTFSAGTVTADVVHGIQDGRTFYPSGFAVS